MVPAPLPSNSGTMTATSSIGGPIGQITQPIQLVHASTFPPPPSPIRNMVTCPTSELPPPPTPLLQSTMEEPDASVKIPSKAPNMNLRAISNANLTVTPTSDASVIAIDDASVAVAAATSGGSYEDIEQAVYDEVDVKYDKMDFSSEPPQPPIRKKPQTQVNTIPPTTIEEPDRPLPETPSKKSLISKLKPKPKKAKEEAVHVEVAAAMATSNSASVPAENAPRPSASLFQRLFHRSKSIEQKPSSSSRSTTSQQPPVVPLHRDDNGNEANQFDDIQIQEFIDEAGSLDNLDNMVTEFANEYMNESSMDQA